MKDEIITFVVNFPLMVMIATGIWYAFDQGRPVLGVSLILGAFGIQRLMMLVWR